MRPTKETFEKWNEELATKHDLDKFYNHHIFAFRYIEQRRIQKLIDLAEIEPSDKVLEVGCGAGHILEKIKTGQLYGIDISEIQIDRAKKRLGSSVELKRAPGENIPYGNKYFNKILCSEVIEHVLDPREVLQEICRVLMDNGILSLSVPNENLINRTKKILNKTGLNRILDEKASGGWELSSKDNMEEWHLHNFSRELAEKFAKNIFSATKVVRIPNILFPFRYVIQYRKIKIA
jgi:ubiquinone/menaquinone biosynthesis C-methylase UbiE